MYEFLRNKQNKSIKLRPILVNLYFKVCVYSKTRIVVCKQVDIITQTETLYELIDVKDYAMVRDVLNPCPAADSAENLIHSSPSSSLQQQQLGSDVISFVCHMNTAGRSARYAPSPIRTGFERTRVSVLAALS